MVDWFNSGLGGLARQVIESPAWRSCRLFPARKIGEEILAAERGKTLGSADWEKTLYWWTCLNLVLWENMFLDSSIKQPANPPR